MVSDAFASWSSCPFLRPFEKTCAGPTDHNGVYHDDTIDCTHFCQASNVPSLWSLLLEQHLLEQHLLRHARAVAERVQL